MVNFVWVLLELKQVKKRGVGNASLPRMSPEDLLDQPDYGLYRPVEFEARYVCDRSSVTDDLRLVVFTRPEKAYDYAGDSIVGDEEDIAVIEVSTNGLLHRVFRGNRYGLCVVDPVPLSAAIAGHADRHELVDVPVTIGELLSDE